MLFHTFALDVVRQRVRKSKIEAFALLIPAPFSSALVVAFAGVGLLAVLNDTFPLSG